MALMSLSLLGPFQVTLAGEPVTNFESDKVRALLAYLAVEAHRPHRRDSLAGLLWPDWPDRAARKNLRNGLANLRQAIGDRTAAPPFLLITRETIQFNTASDYWLDVMAFRTLVEADQPTSHQLEEVVALYRGSFLEGFFLKDSAAFEDWSLIVRERLQRQALAALHRLAGYYEQRGEYEQAQSYAWRQVELEPWDEEAHQQLMRALALGGQRSAALAQYETCRRLLAKELGVEPAEETTRLYEQIRDGKLQVPVPSPAHPPALAAGPPPYKGLQYFDQADAGLFFGRELLTAKLVTHLAPARGDRFLAVVGASGSGKSSIVRAGLIPALQRTEPLAGSLPPAGSARWPMHVITPTAHPLEALAVSLTRDSESVTVTTTLMDDLARDPRSLHLYVRRLLPSAALQRGSGHRSQPSNSLLLVVDQFEELFTLCRSDAERQVFVDNLMAAVETDGPTIVVIALRADFYAHCGQFAPLRKALENRQVYIGPMSTEELRRAVTEPAERGGWAFEPGLVEFLLQEVGDEPGALPLLSHALLETWQRRRGRTLTFGGYSESGGVRGAIAQTAERVLQGLEPEQHAIARNIFLRLTELGEGTQETRRRVKLAELLPRPEDAPAVEAVLQTLADARLITKTEDAVEVAHEVLIREWPTLRGWLEEDREGLRIHRHLTEAAQEWERLDHDPGELYRGARLATASEWAEAHAQELNPLERAFLAASQELARRREAEREAQRQRELEAAQRVAEAERRRAEEQARATRRLRLGALLLAGLSVIAIILAVIASGARATARQERDNAQREAAVNHSLVLAANAQHAQDNGEVDLALALALEAVSIDQPPPEARRTLSAIALGPGTRAVFKGHSNAVKGVAFGPDGKTALSGSCGEIDSDGACVQGELVLWDMSAAAETGTELRRFEGHTGWVNGVAFGPDGKTALSGSGDGRLILWDVETGEVLRRFKDHTGGVNSIAFSPDGQTALSGSDDTTLILWNVITGEKIRRFEGHTGGVTCVALSPNGQTALSCSDDTTLILWNVATGEEIRRFEGHINEVTGVVFHPDGRTMLSTGDHTLRLWDLETGEEIRQQHFGGMPELFAISTDGRTVIFELGGLRLWDIERWREYQWLLGGDSAGVWSESAALSPDGLLALSGSSDGSLRLWNLEGQAKFRRFETDGTPFAAVAVSPDGRRLLTGDMADETVLWDVQRGEVIRRFEGHAVAVSPNSVAFSPDGRYALVGSGDAFGGSGAKSLVLWDIETGKEIRRFEGHRHILRSVAFSPDGRMALSGSQGDEGNDLILWDVETGEQIRRFDTDDDITSIVFSADGSRALTGSAYFSNLILWDVATGQEIRRFEGHTNMVFDVAFGPDETTAISASADGSLILWDVETGAIIRRYLGHDNMVWSLDVSPDGRYVISGSEDGTVILWDFETGEELRRFSGHTALVPGLVFSPDGQTAFSVSVDGALIQWQVADLPLGELIGWIHANRYVRELSCDERELYRIEPLCEE